MARPKFKVATSVEPSIDDDGITFEIRVGSFQSEEAAAAFEEALWHHVDGVASTLRAETFVRRKFVETVAGDA
jgi:hypothetical protein